jgi:signal transduction histidine kinase
MCVIYCSALIRLKFVYSMLISITLCLGYQVSAVILNPIPITHYLSNNFFLVMATTVGLFSGYIQELYVRKSYVQKKIIEAKNKVMNRLLAEAYSANRSKSEFLANMRHELRTPLNAIIGFSEIFAKQIIGPLGTPKYIEYAHDIHSSGIHLLSIINDILDLAKAESGKLDLSEDEVDLIRVVQRSMRMCEHRAQQRRLTITQKREQDPLRVIGDEKLLLQLTLNILSNAVKFTGDGGQIEISLKGDEENGIEMAIADTGIGIPTEDLERVLRPFEQIESTYTRKFKGTGLGLPYAVRVAELHGGRLTIESTVDKGTTVRIWLPPSRFVKMPESAETLERKAV